MRSNGCLRNTTVWFVGNSVQRRRYFAAARLLNTSHGQVDDRIDEMRLCGQGGAAAGKRLGQGSCYGPCTCGSRAPALGTELIFLWQQRVYDASLRRVFLGEEPVSGRFMRARDVVLINAGLDDIANSSCRVTWQRMQKEEAPQIAALLSEARRRLVRVVWLTTSPVCHAAWGLSLVQLSRTVNESNGIIASALQRRERDGSDGRWREGSAAAGGGGVPLLDVSRLDGALSGCEGASALANQACVCKRAYSDHVHPTMHHAQQQLPHILGLACG